jgi:TPP-dependent 2-oxoacid decarboxylase
MSREMGHDMSHDMSHEKLAGHLLVECLIAQGVTHAFGVPGESYLAVLDGLHAHGDRIRFVTPAVLACAS